MKPKFIHVILFLTSFLYLDLTEAQSSSVQEIIIHVGGEFQINLQGLYNKAEGKKQKVPVHLVNAHSFSDADLSSLGVSIYKDLSLRLSRSGHPVLRMHSRAWADNSISPSEQDIADLLLDLDISTQWLLREVGKKEEGVWLIAYGEQALSALWLCNFTEEVAGVILLQPLAFSVVEHVCRQTAQVLLSSGLPDSTGVKYLDLLYVLLRAVRNEDDPGRAYKELNEIVDNHLPFLSDWEIEHLALSKSDRRYLLQHLNSPYMRSFIRLQSRQLYTGCQAPIYCIYGGESDPEWLQRNLEMLNLYKSESMAPNYEVHVLEGLSPFLTRESTLEAKTARQDRKIDDIAWQIIISKIK
jgi:hypothetical protein